MKTVSNKNFLFVILSVLSATIIWMLLANNINPLVHERVSIPIEIRVDSELSDAGRSFTLPIDNQKVVLDYFVRQDDIGKVTANDITAYVNIQKDESSFVDIKYQFNDKRNLMHAITYDKEQVYVTVEDMAHKSIKVTYNIKGRLASENLAVAYVSVEPSEVFVNGPATEVDKVTKIAFDIDISGKDQNFTGNARPLIYDSEGNSLSKDLTLSNTTVNYIVSINSTKTVSFTTSTKGNVAAGYSFAGITVNPSNITISASNDVLSMVQAINIPEIDITDFTENKEFEYTIMEILPRGVKNVSSNKVIKVTVMVNNIRRDPPEYDRNNPDRNRDINPDIVQDRKQGKVDEPTANVIVSPTTTTANSRSDVDNDTTNAHNDSEEETTIEEVSE